MKVLVTGGAGFIGSHLVDAYLKKNYEVVVIDDLSSGHKKNLTSKKIKFYEINLQSDEIFKIVESERPDLVNHHAAQKSVRESVNDPKKDADINLMGLLNLCEALRLTPCRKIIFASSGGVVYGEQKSFPADENHEKKPLSPYGIAKLTSENYLDFYVRQWGFSATCLRYANVYGPRQDPQGEAGVVAIFIEKMLRAEPVTIFGSGKQTRDFVYVDDVVQANFEAEKILNGFQVYNIGTGVETSIHQIHEILKSITSSDSKLQMEAAKAGEQLRSVLSSRSFQAKSNWRPQVSIESGLENTVKWFSTQSEIKF